MSSFTPINLASDSRRKDEDDEKQTRELQVEQGFKMFQEALLLQKDQDYDSAEQKYVQLFKLDILKPKKLENTASLSPSIKSLRYLAHKNRGLLKLLQFQQQHTSKTFTQNTTSVLDLDDEKEQTKLLSGLSFVLKNLTSALDYSESVDDELVDVLFDLFIFFDNMKLSRILLDYQYDEATEELELFQGVGINSSPTLSKLSQRFNLVLNKVYDFHGTPIGKSESRKNSAKKFNKLSTKINSAFACFNFLKKRDRINQKENLENVDELLLELKQINFPELLNTIEASYENKNRISKASHYSTTFNSSNYTHIDPLTSSNYDTTDRIRLDLAQNIENEDQDITHPIIVDIPDSPEPENNDSNNNNNNNNDDQKEKVPQRSSKRVREEINELTINQFIDLKDEFQKLQFTFWDLKVRNKIMSGIVDFFIKDENANSHSYKHVVDSKNPQQVWLSDFNGSIRNWDKRCSSIIVDPKDQQNNLIDPSFVISKILSSTQTIDQAAKVKNSKINFKEMEINLIKEIADKINSNKLDSNIFQLRLLSLICLFSQQKEIEGSKFNLMVDYEFSDQFNFLLNIKKYIDYYQWLIQNKIQNIIIQNNDSSSIERFSLIIVTILEILVDEFITLIQRIKNVGILNTKESNDLNNKKSKLQSKIERWYFLADHLFKLNSIADNRDKTWFRYRWTILLFIQTLDSESNIKSFKGKDIIDLLQELVDETEKSEIEIDIPYLNYTNFPQLNKLTMEEIILKINVSRSFTRVFQSSTLMKDNNVGLSKDAISLLHLILRPNESLNNISDDQREACRFVQNSSFETQLQLRKILLDYYYKNIMNSNLNNDKNTEAFYKNFIDVFQDIVNHLESKEYLKLSFDERKFSLLKNLKFFGKILEEFIAILEFNDWTLESNIMTPENLAIFLNLIGILHIYFMHLGCAKITESTFQFKIQFPRAANEFENMIVNCYIFLFVCLKKIYSLEKGKELFELISNMHALLGFAQICSCSSNRFLKLLQKELILNSNTSSTSDLEVFQLVKCLYDLPLTLSSKFQLYEHKANPIKMTREDAISLNGFFLNLSFEKKDPYFNSSKSDLKAILDTFYEIVAEPNMKYERIIRADAILETYLDSSLNYQIFRQALNGLLNLNISKTNLDFQEVAERGLYYVQGVMALSLYKSRKKSMQSTRPAELDFVIKMFKADLFCGTNRLSSWVLLGQAYSFLVEDDLTWTSDKLNSDRKNATAILQKKAILSYLMAINIYSQINDFEKSQNSKMISEMWVLFSKELYNSNMKPMNRLCYQLSTTPKLMISENGYYETHFEKNPIQTNVINKINLKTFQMTLLNNDEPDWRNFCYIANLQSKLNYTSEIILNNLVKSCEIVNKLNFANNATTTNNNNDSILEPHYKLVSRIYKLVKSKKISILKSIEYLKKDDQFFNYGFDNLTLNNESFKDFYLIIIELLKKILNLDKKKWLHKPRFRIAQILYGEFENLEDSKIEMSNLISLKPNNKKLATIWKTEFERPGKYYVYVYQYIQFYVELLKKTNSLSSICQLLKKLRRSGSTMINMINCWENTCHTFCQLVRIKLNIDKNYSDLIISKLVYKEFISDSSDFLSDLQTKGKELIGEKMLMMLYDVSEIRRMNNGFASTAEIDDSFATVYLLMHEKFVSDNFVNMTKNKKDLSTISNDKNQINKTKVARRDIYPRAIAILKVLSKDIEELQKNDEFMFDKEFNENQKDEPIKIIKEVSINEETVKEESAKEESAKEESIEVNKEESDKEDSTKINKEHSIINKDETKENDDTDDDENTADDENTDDDDGTDEEIEEINNVPNSFKPSSPNHLASFIGDSTDDEIENDDETKKRKLLISNNDEKGKKSKPNSILAINDEGFDPNAPIEID